MLDTIDILNMVNKVNMICMINMLDMVDTEGMVERCKSSDDQNGMIKLKKYFKVTGKSLNEKSKNVMCQQFETL